MWKKIPQYISLWIVIVGLMINLIVHQHRAHQELLIRQRRILQLHQELEQILAEQLEMDEEQRILYQEILGLLHKCQH